MTGWLHPYDEGYPHEEQEFDPRSDPQHESPTYDPEEAERAAYTQQMASGTGGTVAPVRLIPPDDRDREVERIAAMLHGWGYDCHIVLRPEVKEPTIEQRRAASRLYDAGLRASGGTE